MPDNCILCGRPILCSFYRDWAGNKVCSCHQHIPTCVSCNQFCNSKAIDVGTGALLCVHCQNHIMTRYECKHVIDFITKVFVDYGIGEIHNWHLTTMSASALLQKTGKSNVMGLAVKTGNDYTIYMYRHLSKVRFAGILAHEMMHIWQYQRHINADSIRTEGFCELCSYLVLNNINNEESVSAANAVLNNPDPIYGDGARKMKLLFDSGGIQAAVSYLKS